MDFESIALTTRPQLLNVLECSYHKFQPQFCRYQSYRKSLDDGEQEPKPRPQSNVGRGTVTSFGRTSRRIGGGTTGSRQVRLNPDGVIRSELYLPLLLNLLQDRQRSLEETDLQEEVRSSSGRQVKFQSSVTGSRRNRYENR